VAVAEYLEAGDAVRHGLGTDRVGEGLPRVRPAVLVAVGDEHAAARELRDGIRAVEPGGQGADGDHAVRTGRPQHRAATHRVPDQHDRHAGVTPPELGQHRLDVPLGVPIRAVAAAVAVAEHEHPELGAGPSQVLRERQRPPVRQPSSFAGLAAARPAAVGHQDQRGGIRAPAPDRFQPGQRPPGDVTAHLPPRIAAPTFSVVPPFRSGPADGDLEAMSHVADDQLVTRRAAPFGRERGSCFDPVASNAPPGARHRDLETWG
jgi:hypothetical protein